MNILSNRIYSQSSICTNANKSPMRFAFAIALFVLFIRSKYRCISRSMSDRIGYATPLLLFEDLEARAGMSLIRERVPTD